MLALHDQRIALSSQIRQVPFQIDAYLPDGSPVLYVRVRVTNPHEREIPMYWWSNIAVPEMPSTRVVMPADAAFRFTYEAHGLELIPTPAHEGEDYTYPTNIHYSADYFFNIPAGRRPWIAALDAEYSGLESLRAELNDELALFIRSDGPDWIRCEPPDNLWWDVAALESAHAILCRRSDDSLSTQEAEALEDVVDFYAGQFLDGCDQHWCLIERERLRDYYTAILDALTDHCILTKNFDKGIAFPTVFFLLAPTQLCNFFPIGLTC